MVLRVKEGRDRVCKEMRKVEAWLSVCGCGCVIVWVLGRRRCWWWWRRRRSERLDAVQHGMDITQDPGKRQHTPTPLPFPFLMIHRDNGKLMLDRKHGFVMNEAPQGGDDDVEAGEGVCRRPRLGHFRADVQAEDETFGEAGVLGVLGAEGFGVGGGWGHGFLWWWWW